MSEIMKTMLIIEDEEDWKDTIAELCQGAHERLYGNAGKLIEVSSIKEAMRTLEKQPIHFASVDLNLKGEDEDSINPGGLRVLQEIYRKKLSTVSIVVSAERDPNFSAISKKYGVLTFQQKNKPGFAATYQTAVEAAFLYVEAKELLDREMYRAALDKWRQAKNVVKPIEEAGGKAVDWSFPLDIEEEYRARFRHSATRLPTSRIIEDKLADLASKDEWLLFYIEIEHLDAFDKSQGHLLPVNTLLIDTKGLLQEVFTGQTSEGIFMGQTSDNIFVVISGVISSNKQIKILIENLKKRFDQASLRHYDNRTRERGKIEYEDRDGNRQISPLASLNIGFVKGQKNKFFKGWLNKSGDVECSDTDYGDIVDIDNAARQALRPHQAF